MPSTNEATLQLIQREISEVVQREKELKETYARLQSNNGTSSPTDLDISANGNHLDKPNVSNGSSIHDSNPPSSQRNTRLFAQNPTTRGVMQRFIKSKGKMGKLASPVTPTSPSPIASFATTTDYFEPPSPVLPTGTPCRNGFVPVNERIKREFMEMEQRESELRLERRKSQSDLTASLDECDAGELVDTFHARSMSISQFSDCESPKENGYSNGSTLKAARSLADLCAVEDDEIQSPGSLTLIKQWESLIQQRRARN